MAVVRVDAHDDDFAEQSADSDRPDVYSSLVEGAVIHEIS